MELELEMETKHLICPVCGDINVYDALEICKCCDWEITGSDNGDID